MSDEGPLFVCPRCLARPTEYELCDVCAKGRCDPPTESMKARYERLVRGNLPPALESFEEEALWAPPSTAELEEEDK